MTTQIQQQPILSPPDAGDRLNLGGSEVFHRVKSEDTDGVFSVVEFISEPGTGSPVHVHEHEDELVYVIDGEIEVTLGESKMTAGPGVMALLPRGIAHGYTTTGAKPSRVLDVILPGKHDQYFIEMHDLYRDGEPSESTLQELADRYGVRYL